MHPLIPVEMLQSMSGNHMTTIIKFSAATLDYCDMLYRVNVLDFNERGPEFSQNIYYGSIDENLSAGARVITVS